MPLNRPALALGPGPRSVQDARRWVVGTCQDIGRDDLVECAELGVSELVTNALLHAEPPITVRVRGTREHPRVEVRDGSRQVPELPTHDHPAGRGRSAAHVRPRAQHRRPRGRRLGGRPRGRRQDRLVRARRRASPSDVGGGGQGHRGSPSRTRSRGRRARGRRGGLLDPRDPGARLHRLQRHYRELRREIRLLALAHEDDYPLAKNLSDLFGALEQPRAGAGRGAADRGGLRRRRGDDRPERHPAPPGRRAGSTCSSSCSTSPTSSAARSGCCRWPAPRSSAPSRAGSSASSSGRAAARRRGPGRPSQRRGPARPASRDAPAAAAAAGGRGRRRRRRPAALPAGRAGARTGPASRGRRSPSTSSARSLLAAAARARGWSAGAGSWRSRSVRACSAASPRCRRTPSRAGRCWPTATTVARRGLPGRAPCFACLAAVAVATRWPPARGEFAAEGGDE